MEPSGIIFLPTGFPVWEQGDKPGDVADGVMGWRRGSRGGRMNGAVEDREKVKSEEGKKGDKWGKE